MSAPGTCLEPKVSKTRARSQEGSKQQGREQANQPPQPPVSTRSNLMIVSFQGNLSMFSNGDHVKKKKKKEKRKHTSFSF